MKRKAEKKMYSKLTLTLLDGTIIVTKHPKDYILKELEPFSKYMHQIDILLVGDDLHKDEVPADIYEKGEFGLHDLRELYKDNVITLSKDLSVPVTQVASVKLDDLSEFDNPYKVRGSE